MNVDDIEFRVLKVGSGDVEPALDVDYRKQDIHVKCTEHGNKVVAVVTIYVK